MLGPDDLQRIYYWRYRKHIGEWAAAGKPLVQKELQRACWQCVLEAVVEACAEPLARIKAERKRRERYIAELEADNERLGTENEQLKQVILKAIEADAKKRDEHHRTDAAGS